MLRHGLKKTIQSLPSSRKIVRNGTINHPLKYVSHHRYSSGGGGDGKNGKNSEDPFGIFYEDGDDKLGPSLPPQYKRDPHTGKLTGEKEAELTAQERKIFDLDLEESAALLEERLVDSWDEEKEDKVAERLRQTEMSLNVLGRKVDQDEDDDRAEEVSKPLTSDEFAEFQKYMQEYQGVDITDKDIPVEESSATSQKDSGEIDKDLSWIKSGEGDSWMEDIMPSDLSPPKKLNRRQAKPLPKHVLHHNNLELLRRYTTPGGQILNRVQSRLGAKDQRKIAKMIKRARHLGLVPHVGQWKFEDTGNVLDKDIHEKRDWELELERRGYYLNSNYGKEEGSNKKKV